MKFYGELLIFLLLFITNARVLIVKHTRRDPLVSLAPLSLILVILFIIAWGIDFFTITALIISILVLLSNFHALFRYTERLYVDHYSILMKIWSFLTMLLSGAAIVAVIYFHPVELEPQELNITETTTNLTGSFRNGFEEASHLKKITAKYTEFAPSALATETDSATPSPETIILFVPDKRADTFYSRPLLQLLAHEGYTVISGDFYAPDCKWIHSFEDSRFCRRFSLTIRSLLNNQWFMLQREYYTYNISLELNEMYNICKEKYGQDCKIILLSDSMGKTACQDFKKLHPTDVFATFDISDIPDYATAGYGFIAQLDPVLAYLQKVPRDNNNKTLKKITAQTSEQLQLLTGGMETKNDIN